MTRFERKIVLILLGTGLVPLVSTLVLIDRVIAEATAFGFQREVGDQLDRSLGIHVELLESWRREMALQAEAIAGSAALERVRAQGPSAARGLLARRLEGEAPPDRPALVRLALRDTAGGEVVAERPDPEPGSRRREVTRPVAGGGEIVATFSVPRAAIEAHRTAAEVVGTYERAESLREDVGRFFYWTFLAILLSVLGVASGVGLVLARRVTRRIAVLHAATEAVGAGDLAVRVPEGAHDEIGDLTGSFNRMVEELGDSRSKIAYLSKISVWQDVARRLAHEIKNPLQPIQLAMQELHRRFPTGADAGYRKLLDSTLEIVGEEVGTLRRLTTEFSTFARLPEVKLEPDDLHQLLRDCAATPAPEDAAGVKVDWRVPDGPCVVSMDRMLLRRVVDNLVRNAVEAVRGLRKDATGRVVVSVETDPGRRRVRVRVSDNGPGVPGDTRDRLFDPYFTTKAEGTGLGLAIVKKVVLDHGGTIDLGTAPEGGASFVVSLPLRGASVAIPAKTS